MANGVAIQPDGKLVVAGTGGIHNQMLATRLNADGSLDTSFGTGGVLGVDFESRDGAQALALQADGKIVLVGFTNLNLGATDFAIVRLLPNGTLDPSFHTNGKQTVSFGGGATGDEATGVAIQPDGRILVGVL